MFFILSKTIAYLTMPLVIIVILFLISVFIKSSKWKKYTFRSALFLLIFISNDFIANEFIRLWEVPVTPLNEMKKRYEWGIILTGVTKSNTGPEDRVYFQRGADRVVHTVQLYNLGLIKKILVSGGTGTLLEYRRKEAEEIREALLVMGVPAENILTESESKNTHESAQLVKQLLEKQTTSDQCLLITSAFHMRRSRACFEKVGWPIDTFSTDFLSHYRMYGIDTILIPKVEAITVWHTLVKEWVGMVAYKLAGYI